MNEQEWDELQKRCDDSGGRMELVWDYDDEPSDGGYILVLKESTGSVMFVNPSQFVRYEKFGLEMTPVE